MRPGFAVIFAFGFTAHPAVAAESEAPYTSWQSPLTHEITRADRDRKPGSSPTAIAPDRANPAARRIAEVAVLALSVAGKAVGAGRDTTADIGKPLLGVHGEPYEPTVRGSIR